MPSSIFFNGQRQFRPGVYIKAEELLTADTGISGGNVAIIGDFPIFEKGKINTFIDFDSLMSATDGVSGFDDIAYVAFNPMTNASQQIDSLTVINVRGNTQASIAANGLTLKAKLFGNAGNALTVKVAKANDKYDISVFKAGNEVETIKQLDASSIASIDYSGTFYDTASLLIDSSNFQIPYTVAIAAATATKSFLDGANPRRNVGKLVFKTTAAIGAGSQTATITGIGVSDAGVSVTTETVTINTALNGTVTSVNNWSKIEKIDFAVTGGATLGNVEIQGFFENKALSSIDDLGGLLTQLQQADDDFVVVLPSVFVKGSELDAISSSDLKGAGVVSFFKSVNDIFLQLSASAYLDVVKSSNAAVTAGTYTLAGGSEALSIPAANWTDALESILYLGIQILVPWTSDVSIHEKFKLHCTDAANISGYNRNCWVGTSANQSVSQAKAGWSAILNDRNMSVVFQGITFNRVIDGQSLVVKQEEPKWLALMMACMQGSTPIAEPLTNKKPNITASHNTSVDQPLKVATDAIRSGLVILTNAGGLGHKVERSVTSWLKDNSPVYSEVSTNESLNTCLRDLRFVLEQQIGSKATASQLSVVKSIAETRLELQKGITIIKGFKNLKAVISGDVINISFDLALTEPLNFITVTARFGRF